MKTCPHLLVLPVAAVPAAHAGAVHHRAPLVHQPPMVPTGVLSLVMVLSSCLPQLLPNGHKRREEAKNK